uniref:SWI/SNF complex subunit SWI3B n=2 Tax=Rhizophora mucronata TaxID=61149 RepID=A0A2P2JMJ2_RHIMU
MSSSSISSPQEPPGPSATTATTTTAIATATATATVTATAIPPPSSSRLHLLRSSSNPASSPVKPEIPTPTSATHRPPPSSDAQLANFPSYSRWFSWNGIHECELRSLPEFFDSRSASKNPRAYMYYRNSIVKLFRQNPSSKITFTDVRKTLVGDVGSIRRVFDFLDAWGLINYSPPASLKPLKWEDKESKSTTPSQASANGSASASDSAATPSKDTVKRYCSGCKSVCSIACFACDKYDLTLCARCYVRGNYRVGVSSSDFRRVEISEDMRKDWTEKETLQLLEAIMQYGDDWRKVAQNVTGRSEKDCITHFIKLPFGKEFTGSSVSGDVDNKCGQIKEREDVDCGSEAMVPCKRMRLSPLADASNPIMAQAAFLSALAGVDIAEAAAQAAVSVLTEVEYGGSKGNLLSFSQDRRQLDSSMSPNVDSSNLNAMERACLDANSRLEEEELEVERAISRIAEIQMKEIQVKIDRFEELDLQMEKEWQQVERMKSLLFVDQLTHLFPKSLAPKAGDHAQETFNLVPIRIT